MNCTGGASVNAFDVGARSAQFDGISDISTDRVWPVVLGTPNTTVTLTALVPASGCAKIDSLLPGAHNGWEDVDFLTESQPYRYPVIEANITLGAEGCALVRCSN